MYIVYVPSILFYYSASELLDDLKLYSAYPVRGLVLNDKIQTPLDEYVFTDDENALFIRECTNATTRAFDIAHKLSKGMQVSSLYCNKTISLSKGGKGDPAPVPFLAYGFSLVNKGGYNPNLLPMIDNYIKEFIVEQMLYSWWTLTRQADMASTIANQVSMQAILYTNSLFELYKPRLDFNDLEPDIDTEIKEVTVVTEITYIDTLADLPVVGIKDMLYVDRSTNKMYKWDATLNKYVEYFANTSQKSFIFEDVDMLIADHGLGIYMPNVVVEDANGVPIVVDIVPIDVYTTQLRWNQLKSGIAYFSS
jgi:hypothetical protein